MIKKDITFFNLDNEQVTKTFYFNYTKLEAMEIELEYGDLNATIQELNDTEDAKKAYKIFKEIFINAVGVKSADGNEFDKSEAARKSFVNSPAMSVLIWSFIENPESAAPFIESMLPAQDVAEGKARLERERLEKALAAQGPKEIPVAPPIEEVPSGPRTDEEIQAADMSTLTNEELARLVELRKASSV